MSKRRTALDAIVANKIEIETMLARLKAPSDDHFNADPDQTQRMTPATSHCPRRSAVAPARRSSPASSAPSWPPTAPAR
jgi:hypothetical protein